MTTTALFLPSMPAGRVSAKGRPREAARVPSHCKVTLAVVKRAGGEADSSRSAGYIAWDTHHGASGDTHGARTGRRARRCQSRARRFYSDALRPLVQRQVWSLETRSSGSRPSHDKLRKLRSYDGIPPYKVVRWTRVGFHAIRRLIFFFSRTSISLPTGTGEPGEKTECAMPFRARPNTV